MFAWFVRKDAIRRDLNILPFPDFIKAISSSYFQSANANPEISNFLQYDLSLKWTYKRTRNIENLQNVTLQTSNSKPSLTSTIRKRAFSSNG